MSPHDISGTARAASPLQRPIAGAVDEALCSTQCSTGSIARQGTCRVGPGGGIGQHGGLVRDAGQAGAGEEAAQLAHGQAAQRRRQARKQQLHHRAAWHNNIACNMHIWQMWGVAACCEQDYKNRPLRLSGKEPMQKWPHIIVWPVCESLTGNMLDIHEPAHWDPLWNQQPVCSAIYTQHLIQS